MKQAAYMFIGDALHLLRHMSQSGLQILAAQVPEYLISDPLLPGNIGSIYPFCKKQEMIHQIEKVKFDVLICCGYPHVLPISQLKKEGQIFLNLHSSCLPELRGPYPICASLLEGHSAGATLHHMTDRLDQGAIVSQLPVELGPELDLGLLHHIVCELQTRVFDLGLQRGFRADPDFDQLSKKTGSYFRFRADSLTIDLSESVEQILLQIRAFSSRSLGARFRYGSDWFLVFGAEYFENRMMQEMHAAAKQGQVVCIYDSNVVIKKGQGFLKLREVATSTGNLQVGAQLIENPVSAA